MSYISAKEKAFLASLDKAKGKGRRMTIEGERQAEFVQRRPSLAMRAMLADFTRKVK